jgi:membrane associated rhomboid family serine protease
MIPLKDTIRSHSFPAVNWLIIIANILVFVALELSLAPRDLQRTVSTYGLVPRQLTALEPWALVTVFTSMFLHGGWLHIISNLWALYIFGDNVEDRMGSLRYLLFYLICGVVAALAQVYVNPTSRIPMIGASGAIAGVLAAYLILYPTARVVTLVPIFFIPWFIEIPAVLYLVVWFVSQFFSGVMALNVQAAAGGVAYWAHIGGFVAGLLLVVLFARRSRAHTRWYPDEYQPW